MDEQRDGPQELRQVFEQSTREKANGKPRLLIRDGHDTAS